METKKIKGVKKIKYIEFSNKTILLNSIHSIRFKIYNSRNLIFEFKNKNKERKVIFNLSIKSLKRIFNDIIFLNENEKELKLDFLKTEKQEKIFLKELREQCNNLLMLFLADDKKQKISSDYFIYFGLLQTIETYKRLELI